MSAENIIKKWETATGEKLETGKINTSPIELGNKLLIRLNQIYLSGKPIENRSILPLMRIIKKAIIFNSLSDSEQAYLDFTFYNNIGKGSTPNT